MYQAAPLIILAIGFGYSMYLISKCMEGLKRLHKEIQMLRFISDALGKQQMMEAEAIQELANSMIGKKYGKKSELDKSEPIFKTPQGEA